MELILYFLLHNMYLKAEGTSYFADSEVAASALK